MVPLTIPATRVIRSPASDSRSGRSSGIAPGHRRLVVEVGAGGVGGLGQRRAVLGEQRLVRRHHRLARLERLQQQRAGRARCRRSPRRRRPRRRRATSADASVVTQLAQLRVPVRAAHGHPDQLERGHRPARPARRPARAAAARPPPPTVPQPSRATRRIALLAALGRRSPAVRSTRPRHGPPPAGTGPRGLAAQDRPRRAVADGDHRGARQPVVAAGHRVAVRARWRPPRAGRPERGRRAASSRARRCRRVSQCLPTTRESTRLPVPSSSRARDTSRTSYTAS